MNDLVIKQDYRCPSCKKLLLKGLFVKSRVEVKCSRCGSVVSLGDITFPSKQEYALLLTTQKGNVVDCSESIQKHLGYTIDDILGKHVSVLFVDNEDVATDDALISTLKHQPYIRFDVVYCHKNGESIPVSVWCKKIEREGVVYILRAVGRSVRPVVSPEVDEILRAMDKDAESVFSSDISCGDINRCDLVAEFDIDTRLMYVSAAAAQLHGYKQEELLGRSIMDFFAVGEYGWDLPHLVVLAVRREPFKTVAYTKHKDGHTITTDAIATPFYDDRGNYLGYQLMGWVKQ